MRVGQTGQGQLGGGPHHVRIAAPARLVGYADGLGRRQVALPAVDEKPDGRRPDLHGLAGDPADVARVRAAQPVQADAVVQTKGVETELEGAHVEGSMRAVVVLAGRRLGEEGGRAVAAGLGQDGLGELAHEVGTGFGGLVRYRGLGYRGALALVLVARGAVERF